MMKILILCLLIISCSILRRPSSVEDVENSKVNSKGQYVLFPGVTVVSSVGAKNKKMWERVHKELNKSSLIKSYFALLPTNSYHMTTINLFTKAGTGESWNSFVENRLPWFQKLNSRLATEIFKLQVVNVVPEFSGQTIRILIQLDASQKEKMNSLAKDFSLEKKIPVPFHVTLGYLYKEIKDKNKKEVVKEFKSILNRILSSYSNPIVFQEPKLCYFQDMTNFTPWDGKYNPFVRGE